MNANLFNPFYNTAPIREVQYLHGRNRLLTSIVQLLTLTRPAQSMQLVGLPRIGKTSILYTLRDLPNAKPADIPTGIDVKRLRNFKFIYVDCLSVSNQDPRSFWKLIGLALDRQLPDNGFDTISDNYELQYRVNIYRQKNDRHTLVFLLDGFDAVVNNKNEEWLHQLRALIRPPFAWIVSLEKELALYKMEKMESSRKRYVSQIDSVFMTLYVGLLEEPFTRTYLNSRIQEQSDQSSVRFSDENVTWINERGGRHPALCLSICQHLFDVKENNAGGAFDDDDLAATIYDDYRYGLYEDIKAVLPEAKLEVLKSVARQSDATATIPTKALEQLGDLGLVVTDSNLPGKPRCFSGLMEEVLTGEGKRLSTAESSSGIPAMTGSGNIELKLWPSRYTIQYGDRIVSLTRTEWRMFDLLFKSRGATVPYRDYLDVLWGLDVMDDKDSRKRIGVHMSRLRKKLDELGGVIKVKNKSGTGYQMLVEQA